MSKKIVAIGGGHNIETYGIKAYWKNNKYIEEKIDTSDKFKSLSELLAK